MWSLWIHSHLIVCRTKFVVASFTFVYNSIDGDVYTFVCESCSWRCQQRTRWLRSLTFKKTDYFFCKFLSSPPEYGASVPRNGTHPINKNNHFFYWPNDLRFRIILGLYYQLFLSIDIKQKEWILWSLDLISVTPFKHVWRGLCSHW